MIKENESFQRGNVILIALSHFLHDVYTSFLAPALPLIIERLNISYGLAGLLSVIQRIPSLLNPFVGIMAENMRMRYLIIISPALTGVAMSLIGVAPSYIFLAILLLVSGISSTFFHIPTPVMIRKISGKTIGKGMSYYMLGGELARTAGPLIIFGVISLWGIQGTYRMMPFGLIASALLYYRLRNIEISSRIGEKEWKPRYFREFVRYLPIFGVTAGITLFLGAMRSSLTLYLPTFLKQHGESLFFADSSLAVLQLAGAAGTFISGTISDKLGRSNTLLIISVISPFLMFLFLYASGLWQMVILAVMGLFIFAPTSVLLAVVQEQKSENLAFLNGTFMLINFFISASMVTLAGVLADHIGFHQTFFFSAIFSVGSVLVVLLSRKKLG